MGVGEDIELGNNISVTVIATGFGDEKQQSLVNSETKKVIYTLDEDHPFEKKLIEEDLDEETEIIEDKLNDESPYDFQQKKIESEINEILRNIEISYEVVEADEQLIDINEIEIIDFEHVLPEDEDITDNQENYDEISFGLFSDNLEKEVVNNNDFDESNVDEQTSQFDELNSYVENEDEEGIEFIKLDLNDNVNQIEETKTGEEESNNESIDFQEDNYLFEKPIEVDSNNENIIRRENLKKYNHVFKSNNSSIEDLEKIPAYKRMGIEINNLKSEGDEIFSKTILNEENKLEFPDVNTYLHDNVD